MDKKIYSKAKVLVLDGTGMDNAKFEQIKKHLLYDQYALQKKDGQLAEERQRVDKMKENVLQLKLEVYDLKKKSEVYAYNMAELKHWIALKTGECDELRQTLKEERSKNLCIRCYERVINCIIAPCGHQITCIECSQELAACPLCNAKKHVIRTYRL